MYAIIESGGKQYRVSEGDLIDVECHGGEVGQSLSFDEVLLVGDQKTIHLGTPVLSGARVVGTIAEQGQKDKVIVFKFKRRKKYRRKQGHRQLFTRVRIDQIELAAKKAQKPKTEQVKEKAAKAVKKPSPKKEAAPSKTTKKKASKKVAAKEGRKAPKKQAAKAPKKTAAKAKKSKAKVAKKKTTKSVKKTTKKSTKKTAQKKDRK